MRRALVLFAILSAGCVTVRPWQRERFARRCMELDAPTGTTAFDAHVRAVRSGDISAGGAGGGGCGCN